MPKETIKTRDGEVGVGWNDHNAQIYIDLGKPFVIDGETFTSLWLDLDPVEISKLSTMLNRVNRYLYNHI